MQRQWWGKMLGSTPGQCHQTVLIVTVFFSSVHLQIKECWLHLRMSLIELYRWLVLLNLYSSSHHKMGHMHKAVLLPKEVGRGLEVKRYVIVGVVSWTSCFVQRPWCVFERTTDKHCDYSGLAIGRHFLKNEWSEPVMSRKKLTTKYFCCQLKNLSFQTNN